MTSSLSTLRLLLFLLVLLLASLGLAQTPRGDVWLLPPGTHPEGTRAASVKSNSFAALRAESVAGKIQVTWAPESAIAPTQAILHASTGGPGHWPARDWRSYAMRPRDTQWHVLLPIEDLEEPVIYFVHSFSAGAAAVSPMRLLSPRDAGLEEPTRPFWPFLEGFEEGLESWRLLSGAEGTPPLATSASAKTGRAALLARLPPGKRSLTLATTRLRGWLIEQRHATGVCLWLRTAEGQGRARFSVAANALTPQEIARVWSSQTALGERWQRVDLYFEQLPALPLGAIDLFSVEFIADGPRELLIDDLQLLGPWQLDLP